MISFESHDSEKSFASSSVKFSRDLAGYAAGGLTQPSENKTYSNKVGWDKRSVPNMLLPEEKPFNFPKEMIFETDQIDFKSAHQGSAQRRMPTPTYLVVSVLGSR